MTPAFVHGRVLEALQESLQTMFVNRTSVSFIDSLRDLMDSIP